MTDSSFLGAVREKFKPSTEAVRVATEASGFVDEDSPPDAMLLRAVGRMLQAAYAVDAQAIARAVEALGPRDHMGCAPFCKQCRARFLDALGVGPPEMRKEQL